MIYLLNSVSLCGILGFDVELKRTVNGKIYTDNSIGVQANRKNQDDVYPWYNINFRIWGHSAEFLERNFKKGDAISITGELFTFKQEFGNVTKELVWVRADDITFVPRSRNEANTYTSRTSINKQTELSGTGFGSNMGDFSNFEDDGDLPF